jgi:hypothetical protein
MPEDVVELSPEQKAAQEQERLRQEEEERNRQRQSAASMVNSPMKSTGFIQSDKGIEQGDTAYSERMAADLEARKAEGVAGGANLPPVRKITASVPGVGSVGKRVTPLSEGIRKKAEQIYSTRPGEVEARQRRIAESQAEPIRESQEVYPYTEVDESGKPLSDNPIPYPYSQIPGLPYEAPTHPNPITRDGRTFYRAKDVLPEGDPLSQRNVRIGYRPGYEPGNEDEKIPSALGASAALEANEGKFTDKMPVSGEQPQQGYDWEDLRKTYGNIGDLRRRQRADFKAEEKRKRIGEEQERIRQQQIAEQTKAELLLENANSPFEGQEFNRETGYQTPEDYTGASEDVEFAKEERRAGVVIPNADTLYGATAEQLADRGLTQDQRNEYKKAWMDNLISFATTQAERAAAENNRRYLLAAKTGGVPTLTDQQMAERETRLIDKYRKEIVDTGLRQRGEDPFNHEDDKDAAPDGTKEEMERRQRIMSLTEHGVDVRGIPLDELAGLEERLRDVGVTPIRDRSGRIVNSAGKQISYDTFARYPEAYPTEPKLASMDLPGDIDPVEYEKTYGATTNRAGTFGREASEQMRGDGTPEQLEEQARRFHKELNENKFAYDLRELEGNFRKTLRSLPKDDKRARAQLFSDYMQELSELNAGYGEFADDDYLGKHGKAQELNSRYKTAKNDLAEHYAERDRQKKLQQEAEREIEAIYKSNTLGNRSIATTPEQEARINELQQQRRMADNEIVKIDGDIRNTNKSLGELEDQIEGLTPDDVLAMHPEKYRNMREKDHDLFGSIFDFVQDPVAQDEIKQRVNQMYNKMADRMDEYDDLSPREAHELDKERRQALQDLVMNRLKDVVPDEEQALPYGDTSVQAYREGIERANKLLEEQLEAMPPEDAEELQDNVRQDAVLKKPEDQLSEEDAQFLASRNTSLFSELYGSNLADIDNVYRALNEEMEDFTKMSPEKMAKASEGMLSAQLDGDLGLSPEVLELSGRTAEQALENARLLERMEKAAKPERFKTDLPDINKAAGERSDYVERGEGRTAPDTLYPEKKEEEKRLSHFKELIKNRATATGRDQDYVKQHLTSSQYREFPGWVDSGMWEQHAKGAGKLRTYDKFPEGMIPDEKHMKGRLKPYQKQSSFTDYLKGFIPGYENWKTTDGKYMPKMEGEDRNTYQMSNGAMYTVIDGLGALRISAGNRLSFTPEYRQAIDNISKLWNFGVDNSETPDGQEAIKTAKLAYEQLDAADRGFYEHESPTAAGWMMDQAREGAVISSRNKGDRPTRKKTIDYESLTPEQFDDLSHHRPTMQMDAKALGMDLKDYERYLERAKKQKDLSPNKVMPKPSELDLSALEDLHGVHTGFVKAKEERKLPEGYIYRGEYPEDMDRLGSEGPMEMGMFREAGQFKKHAEDSIADYNIKKYNEANEKKDKEIYKQRMPVQTPHELLDSVIKQSYKDKDSKEFRGELLDEVYANVAGMFQSEKLKDSKGENESRRVYGSAPVFSYTMFKKLVSAHPNVDRNLLKNLSFVTLNDIISSYESHGELAVSLDPRQEEILQPYISYRNPWAYRKMTGDAAYMRRVEEMERENRRAEAAKEAREAEVAATDPSKPGYVRERAVWSREPALKGAPREYGRVLSHIGAGTKHVTKSVKKERSPHTGTDFPGEILKRGDEYPWQRLEKKERREFMKTSPEYLARKAKRNRNKAIRRNLEREKRDRLKAEAKT